MRSFNEHIARKFWESRFKSHSLFDEQVLLTCTAYVELNSIRAKMAYTPETSDSTSIKQRIDEQEKVAN